MDDDSRMVTVCDKCLMAACWRGLFMCDRSASAGTTRRSVGDLRLLDREHPGFYKRDDDNYPEPGVDVTAIKQLHILRHSLGIERSGGREYRNHFVTGPGSDDYADCTALVEQGLMTRRAGNALSGGDDIFYVTEAGKAAAKRGM